MDRKTEDTEIRALLEQLVEDKRRDVRTGRIIAFAAVVLAVTLLIGLALTVPGHVKTIEEAHTTIEQTQELIQRANTSLDAFDKMTESISGVVDAGTEKLDQVTAIINSVDLEAFSSAVQKLGSVLEGLSGLRLFN